MNKEEIDESPYCEVCGTCGCIGCCGIRNFITKHIEGKTNCKNEGWIIQDLINLCDYKDEVFKQNKKQKEVMEQIKDYIEYSLNNPLADERLILQMVLAKLKVELEGDNK